MYGRELRGSVVTSVDLEEVAVGENVVGAEETAADTPLVVVAVDVLGTGCEGDVFSTFKELLVPMHEHVLIGFLLIVGTDH